MHPELEDLFRNLRHVIVGKDQVLVQLLTALLARGHVLIEDAPGLGKTVLARALAQSLDCKFRRVQLTPDMLPADITGVSIYRPDDHSFHFTPGPIFAQVLLADELNRTSPRTQAALLEAMEEGQVTVEGVAHPLDPLFLVVATQNPIELQGTFPLPEAQLDRFLMRLTIGYPTPQEEAEILQRQEQQHPLQEIEAIASAETILRLQKEVRNVHVASELRDYVVALANATRHHEELRLGISPRGSLALIRAAQAYAFIRGSEFVAPDHVKAMTPAVFEHRLLLNPQRQFTGRSAGEIITSILQTTPVPTQPNDSQTSSVS